MNKIEKYDHIVGLIYEAALEPTRLQEMLTALTDWLDGDTCHLIGWGTPERPWRLSFSVNIPQEAGETYVEREHHAPADPRRALVMRRPPGSLLLCHEHFDRRYVAHSEFFQDYLLPLGLHYLLGTSNLAPSEMGVVQLGFHRPIGRPPFSRAQANQFARVIPHLMRALRLMGQSGGLALGQAIAQASLDSSPLGIFALSAAGKLEYANTRGVSLLRHGIGVAQRAGYLVAVKADERTVFESALRRTATTSQPSHVALRSDAPAKEPSWLCLTILKLPENGRYALHHRNAAVLCLATHAASQRTITGQQLMALFGLTPAEARLAKALTQDETLDDYATQNQLSLATVKSQLRNVFVKTGTMRQAQLIRLLSMIPAVREPYGAQEAAEFQIGSTQHGTVVASSPVLQLHERPPGHERSDI